jgi:hypothetical protein
MSMRVYPLKYSSAAETAEIVRQIIGNIADERFECIAEDRTNTLVVVAGPETLDRVATILKTLDVASPRQAPASRETRIFTLGATRVDQYLERSLGMVLGKEGSFVADPARDLVIVKADEAMMRQVEQLLNELDRPTPPEVSTRMVGARVRVAWLVSGLDLPTAPPSDLKSAVDEAARLGADDLRLAAQMMVQAASDGRFQVSSAPKLEKTCGFRVEGKLTEAAGQARRLEVTLEAYEYASESSGPRPPGAPGPAPGKRWGSLQTTVVVPVGQPVVLSVTPTDEAMSVFVIQLLPDTPPAPPAPVPPRRERSRRDPS